MTEVYLNTFFEIQHDYIERAMCRTACPCSPKINPDLFGQRKEEFSLRGLDTLSGLVSSFYDDCYVPRVESKEMAAIDSHILDLVRDMERTHNCQGLCKANLFYFFRSSQYGPPPSDCRQPIETYFITEWGILGIVAALQGVNHALFFFV